MNVNYSVSIKAQHGKDNDLYLDRYVSFSDEGATTMASSTSTLMQTVETIRCTTKPSNIETIRKDMRKDIATHESFLDSLCEDSMHGDFLLDDGNIGNLPNQRKPHLQQLSNDRRASTGRSGVPVAVNRRQSFDSKAKSKLLEGILIAYSARPTTCTIIYIFISKSSPQYRLERVANVIGKEAKRTLNKSILIIIL